MPTRVSDCWNMSTARFEMAFCITATSLTMRLINSPDGCAA